MNITYDLFSQVEITGDGSSRWAGRNNGSSKGTFHVSRTTLSFCGFDNPEDPQEGAWELNCYGKDLHWWQYTDRQIEKEVMEKIAPLFGEHVNIKTLGWSEQGMQPEHGWDFDVVINKTGDKNE